MESPSGRITETLAVFVHADIPEDSAEITFESFGKTCEAGVSQNDRYSVKNDLPPTTAL